MDLIKQIDENQLNYLTFNQIVKILAELNQESELKIKGELNNLLLEGKIVNTSKKKIATAKTAGYLEGTISIAKRGYGFFIPDDKSIPDIFIPFENLNGAMNNDRVVVLKNFNKTGEKLDGKVMKVLTRGTSVVVGKVDYISSRFAQVIADDKKFGTVLVRPQYLMEAKKGDKVVVKLTKYDTKMPEGKVIEVLLSDNPVNVDVLSIVRQFELYEEFPKEVLTSADKVKREVTNEDIQGREDFRSLTTFTIDGEDARDFDDAITISKNQDGTYLLGVHIADVGDYVKFESFLDREAFKRGTSVYFPNAVFPMLPKQLSNGICSLNEKVDRLTLSCLMKIDTNGNVLEHKICEGVINSDARLTYTKVAKMMEGDEKLRKQYDFLVNDLDNLKELTLILEKMRKKRGTLNFEIPEPKIILNDKLEIEKFEARPNTIADRMIESSMLIANETVAKEFCTKMLPFVYRVHEKPNVEKLENFAEFVKPFGLEFVGDFENMSAGKIQKFLNTVPDEQKTILNKVLLRAMQKAKYSESCLGHYGLGAEYYCHFTSPIRRYPDLTIHRIIKDYLHNELKGEKLNRTKSFVSESAMQSSVRETVADKAEREVDDYFKARYMMSQKGKIFDGIISGVTDRGLFVELDNTCEGFISVYNLPDERYEYNELHMSLNGSSTKFKIGDKIKIKVSDVNIEERKIDFIYENEKIKQKAKSTEKSKKKEVEECK